VSRRPYIPGTPIPYDPVAKDVTFALIGWGPNHDHTKAVRDRARDSAERIAALHNEVDPAPSGPARAKREAA
jgi:hypothetical protein